MNYKYFGLIVVPMISLGIIGIFTMINLSAYSWLFATLFFWIMLSGLGIATGFHRVYSHQCYSPKPWLDNILLICGTLACQSSSLTWVSTHIGYHHRYADTEKDPHTPVKGTWYSFMGWTYSPIVNNINHRYSVKLLRKSNHIFFHKHYFKIVWLFVLLASIIFGWKSILFGYCIAATISILQDNLVNVLGHSPKLGYRNFDTKDVSSNFLPLGYLGWGQGWHNNHHYSPAKFDFGIKWWEYDPCRLFIPLLKLGSYDK